MSVAILFRGQAFRDNKKTCTEDSIDKQLSVAQSIMENIVQPLEQENKRVDIYFSETSNCMYNDKLVDMYGARIVATNFETSKNQGESVHGALDLYENGGQLADTVIMLRHDNLIKKDIREWTIDQNKINFLAKCEKSNNANIWGSHCVHDAIHVVPQSQFATFKNIVGKETCFSKTAAIGEHHMGHGCAKYIDDNYNLMSTYQTVVGFNHDKDFDIMHLVR